MNTILAIIFSDGDRNYVRNKILQIAKEKSSELYLYKHNKSIPGRSNNHYAFMSKELFDRLQLKEAKDHLINFNLTQNNHTVDVKPSIRHKENNMTEEYIRNVHLCFNKSVTSDKRNEFMVKCLKLIKQIGMIDDLDKVKIKYPENIDEYSIFQLEFPETFTIENSADFRIMFNDMDVYEFLGDYDHESSHINCWKGPWRNERPNKTNE